MPAPARANFRDDVNTHDEELEADISVDELPKRPATPDNCATVEELREVELISPYHKLSSDSYSFRLSLNSKRNGCSLKMSFAS